MKWLKKFNVFGSDTMMLTIMVWLCALPLIGIFILPYFGGKAAIMSAGIFFILALLVCWGICGWNAYQNSGN